MVVALKHNICAVREKIFFLFNSIVLRIVNALVCMVRTVIFFLSLIHSNLIHSLAS